MKKNLTSPANPASRASGLIAAGAKGNGPESITSHMGRFSHFSAAQLEKSIFDSVGWDYDMSKHPRNPSSRWFTHGQS